MIRMLSTRIIGVGYSTASLSMILSDAATGVRFPVHGSIEGRRQWEHRMTWIVKIVKDQIRKYVSRQFRAGGRESVSKRDGSFFFAQR